ncbi:hypothetical protein ACHAQH_000676 [Verticillium albo-atrum]
MSQEGAQSVFIHRDQLPPWSTNGQHQQEQSAGLHQALLSGRQPGHPSNATELAVSLVNLVFPYDVRNTQRSLCRMYDRVKAVEARAADDSAARHRAEQAIGALEKEMSTLQALVAKARPDPSEQMGVEALEREVGQKHEKMVEMVSEFNAQRESLLVDINRLVNQTKQIQEDIVARGTPAGKKPPGSQEQTSGGLAGALTELAPEAVVEKEAVRQAIVDDISTASESEAELLDPIKGDIVGGLLTTETSPAEDSRARGKKGRIIGRKLNDVSPPVLKELSTKRNLRSTARIKPQQSPVTSPKPATTTNPHGKLDTKSNIKLRSINKPVEHRNTEKNMVVKQKASDGRLRRLAFTRFAKFIDAKARTEQPRSIRAHKLLIWEFIDGMEDKEMAVFVQNMLLDTFPDTVITSKGRGKPFRQVILEGKLEWNQVLEAIKNMPIPPFFLDGS